jgi:hypothetical protein
MKPRETPADKDCFQSQVRTGRQMRRGGWVYFVEKARTPPILLGPKIIMITIPAAIKSRRFILRYSVPALIAVGVLAPFTARGASSITPRLLAAVDVNIYLGAPPAPRHEVIVERDRPSRNHVWVAGYWANRHGRHEWISGHWELPPRGRTIWIAPRWEKRDRGYVFIDGYWAEPHHEHDNDHHDHH